MQRIKLPAGIKIPGVAWVILIVGFGIWSYYNVDDPVLLNLIMGGILIVLRTLVNNDAALEKAAGAGQSLLDYIFRQPRRVTPPSVAESGMRGESTMEAVEPIPNVEIPRKPDAVTSWLFG